MSWTLLAPVVGCIVVTSYLLGSIPFGLIVSKSQGLDIREHGSKNIGATNVWRVMGKKWGLTTFICDVLKGLAAVLLGKWIAAHWAIHVPLPHGHERIEHLAGDFAGIAAAMGCILGHNFPVWLRFKGGKGVATSLGVIFGMMPLAALLTFAVWGVVFKVSRYVSLASLLAAVALPIIVVGMLFFGGLHGWGNFYFAVAAALLVIRRHRENIARLVAGTENRFGTKPATTAAPGETSDSPQP
jgi:glycerol-3-phosphate acyltransferase PlsY